MRIGFYAPLKPADHPVPSGDRRMARLLIAALRQAGHEVRVMSRLRTWDGAGDERRQQRLDALGGRMAARVLRQPWRPDLWFTYHLYHKAPDGIGPRVAAALSIPYVVAEASHAPKRAGGPWAAGHAAVAQALAQAAAVIGFNPADRACVEPLLGPGATYRTLPPFLDTTPYSAAVARRAAIRLRLAEELRLDPAAPWLVTLAMMRPGDKLASYRLLAKALQGVADRPWQLLVLGDGPARPAVEAAFARYSDQVRFASAIDPETVPDWLAAADLMAWPAVNEAYGMALLEAQAAGLPVVAGRFGGVAGIVEDGETGLLAMPGDATDFGMKLAALLDDTQLRHRFGRAALERVATRHGLPAASEALDAILQGLAR